MFGQQFGSLFLPIWLAAQSEKHSAWCKEGARNIQQEERETISMPVLISSHCSILGLKILQLFHLGIIFRAQKNKMVSKKCAGKYKEFTFFE